MMRRLRAYLVTPGAGKLIPWLVIALPLLSSASRMFFGGLAPSTEGPRQISGYYLDALLFGLLLLLLIAWVISIVSLMGRKSIRRGIGRIVAIPVVGFVSFVLWSTISSVILQANVCGWPSDTVYSQSRDKHYIVASEPPGLDVGYRVFSVKVSLLTPIWQRESSDLLLGWPEDETQRGRLHLTLSGNEQLLVVGRGEQLIYAILIDNGEDLTDYMALDRNDNRPFWQQRNDWIRALLAANAADATLPAIMVGSKIEIPAGAPVKYRYGGRTVVIGDPLASEIIAALNEKPEYLERVMCMVLDSQKQLRLMRRDRVFQDDGRTRPLNVGGMSFGVDEFGIHLIDDWGYRSWHLDAIEAKLAAAAD